MKNSSNTPAPRWRGFAPAAVVALAAALVYLNSLDAPFHYDDYETVINNKNIRIFSDLPSILLHSPFRGVLFLTFALSYRVSGADPFGFHLFNLAAHVLNAVLVFALARGLCRRLGGMGSGGWGPLLGGLLFAVHPAFTEAVTYVSSRSSLLATTFYLACVLAFLRYRDAAGPAMRAALWTVAFAAFLLGLLTKELLATAPFVLLLLDWLQSGGGAAGARGLARRLAFPHGPFLLVLALGGAARIHTFATRELVGGTLPRGVCENVVTQMQVVVVYLRLLVAPFGLNLIHDFPTVRSFWEFPTPLCALLLVLLVGAAVRLVPREPVLAFGILWYFVALLPSSSFIPFQEALAEHHLYLPGVGFCIVAGVAAARVLGRLAEGESAWFRPAVAAAGAILLTLAGLTAARNHVWGDEIRLWRDTVAKTPGSWATHYAFGDALRRNAEVRQSRAMELRARGDHGSSRREFQHSVKSLGDAIEQYTITLAHRPDHVDSLLNRGICHAMLAQSGGGEPEIAAAESDLRRALEIGPNNTKALNNLGNIATIRRDHEQAKKRYLEVLAIDPGNLNANVNLGSLYLNQYKDRESAYAHYYRAYQALMGNREYERAKALARILREAGYIPASPDPPSAE
ncbi:MAG: hypothetical protein HY897_18570 [Deltaproteobacteria bacterium]|nr:hypothetical protein [Deltaproteobacteria bacterium]